MPRRRLKLFILMALLAACADTAAPASHWTTPAPKGSGCAVYDVSLIINRIDVNRDGKMTHAEWTAAGAPEPSFHMLDAKHRGYVTATQFAATTPPPGIDFKHDCTLTVDDMNEMGRSMPPPTARRVP